MEARLLSVGLRKICARQDVSLEQHWHRFSSIAFSQSVVSLALSLAVHWLAVLQYSTGTEGHRRQELVSRRLSRFTA